VILQKNWTKVVIKLQKKKIESL